MQDFLDSGCNQAQVLEVIFGVALRTLTNYSNHIAKPAFNEQFVPFLPNWAAWAFKREKLMNSVQFPGFPKDLLQFLTELAANNNREWFTENKARYQQSVLDPVSNFIEAIATELNEISPHFLADPRPHRGSMFRIYRDTRFAKDKRPYKENVGCHFRHIYAKGSHALGYYMHIQPENSFAGAGIWRPSTEDLEKVRNAIAERADDWANVRDDTLLLKHFGNIQGESLKRIPSGYVVDCAYADDLKRKSFFVQQPLADQLLRSPKLVKEVGQTYKNAKPLMQFLADALELPY